MSMLGNSNLDIDPHAAFIPHRAHSRMSANVGMFICPSQSLPADRADSVIVMLEAYRNN